MSGQIPIWMLKPQSDAKRRLVGQRLAARRQTTAPFDLDGVKARLREARTETAERLEALVSQLACTCDQRYGLVPFAAATAEEAARHIAEIAGPGGRVLVNRSAVVNEIRPALEMLGLAVVATYDDEYTHPESGAQYYWDLQGPEPEAIWESFDQPKPALRGAHTRDAVAVLGVNSISAVSGMAYFVEHLENISRLLREARHVVLLVGIDKVAAHDEDARMVAQCMALFGAPSVALMAPRRGHDQGAKAALDTMPLTSAVPEQHVVLLDNGRRRLLSSPYHTLFLCIGCRACMRECPTFPYFAADTSMTPRDHLWQAVRGAGNRLEDCVGCGRCKTLCPLDIDLPVMISRMKGQQPKPQDVFFKRIELLFRLCSATAPVTNLAFQTPLVRYPAEWVSGMDHRRVLPRFRRDSFQRWAAARTERPVGRHKVVYYYGCYVNYTDPELGRAVVGLLERNNCEVAIPAQVCCGVAAFAYGDWDLARRYAQATIRSLVPWVDQGYRVVVTCPSCALALLRDFCHLLPGNAAAERLAQSTIDLSTFVLELAAQGEWETLSSPVPLKVGYHTPCHLRVRGGGMNSLALLRSIPALEVVPLDRGCCGLAGSYGMKAANFDRSLEIGGRVASFIAEQNCQAVSTDCAGCEMQLHALTGLPVFHPAKLLWRSMADRPDDSRSLQAGWQIY